MQGRARPPGVAALRFASLLCAVTLGQASCKRSSAITAVGDAAPSEAAVEVDALAEAGSEKDAEQGDVAREVGARRALTQEEQLEEAAKRVSAAVNEAKEKKPDCDKIVDLLDVSLATTGLPMTPDDKALFSVFASCAKKAQRWRLLRVVANTMIAGDPAMKTTYYLPRALVGLGQYDTAARLSRAALKAWPKEGEAYTTGALASSRLEDWDSCSKEADQALLIERQKGTVDEISAQAHVFKAEALLHQGKVDESSKELDLAKKIKAYELAVKLRERNDVVKSSGVLVDADLPDEVPLGVYPLLAKPLALTGGLVTLRMQNVSDKPVSVRVEVSLGGVADPIGKSVTLVKGRKETLKLTPPLRPDFRVDAHKTEEKHDLAYKVTTGEGQTLFEETRKATVLPRAFLPLAIQTHQTDSRPVPELAGAWITPAAKTVTGLLEAAKKRASGELNGVQGLTLPQVKALWDELRERGFDFVRDPTMDSEAQRSHVARLPSEVIGAQSGNALEGALLFASLFEAIGLDVVLVRVPGHAFVGWTPSKSDRAAADAMSAAVQSPAGTAFFLETTMVSSAPADAAVLRGDAELVDAATKRLFDDGRGSVIRLSQMRKLGVVPQAD